MESLGGSERQREAAQEGGSCLNGEGRETGPCTEELKGGRLTPVNFSFKNQRS